MAKELSLFISLFRDTRYITSGVYVVYPPRILFYSLDMWHTFCWKNTRARNRVVIALKAWHSIYIYTHTHNSETDLQSRGVTDTYNNQNCNTHESQHCTHAKPLHICPGRGCEWVFTEIMDSLATQKSGKAVQNGLETERRKCGITPMFLEW